MSGGERVGVSIPSSVRKTIEDLKEITGNHSEDEIYAMLKECLMDPNETAQKLLFQDPFHEVKRKRDRKKENTNNKESGDSRWRPGTQGRGNRGGRPNFSPRYTSHDASSGGKNSGHGRDNGANQASGKGVGPSFPASKEKAKETTMPASLAAIFSNGPTSIALGSASAMHNSNPSAGDNVNQDEMTSLPISANKLGSVVSPSGTEKTPSIAFGAGNTHVEPMPSSSDSSLSVTPASSSTVCFSSSDPVLVPSDDLWVPGTVGTIRREMGSLLTVVESNVVVPADKLASKTGSSFPQGKITSKSDGVGKTQLNEFSQPSSASVHSSSSGSRPSSNYGSRSQQIIGTQKAVGYNKEWKPKPTNANVPQGSGTAGSLDTPNVSVEASSHLRPATSILDSEEAASKLQKKLEELHLPQRQHVIIPNHIHVPDSERTKLSFGSFDAGFGVTSTYVSGSENNKSSSPVSESSQGVEEFVEELAASNQNALLPSDEGAYPEHPQLPSHVPGNLSGEDDVPSAPAPDYNDSEQENTSLSGGHQYSTVHTSPTYSLGLVPPMLGGQLAPFENSESQARDASRLPGFVVQQPFDPANYYPQLYRSGADSDGRVSPFLPPGVAAKYNGNFAVLPPHNSQSPQEGGNAVILSTASPPPLVTPAAGLVPSSIPGTQQPVTIFRPPTGLHLSHYPPNYIPYGHYFSPFYVPPPGFHQFLSNGAFPQQPQAGSVYPAPAAAAATGIKYPLPQYKPGTNTGNSTHMVMPSGYGPYGSSPASCNPSSAGTGGNSTANEELGASQFKDSNIYVTGQQSEGSALWIAAAPPGRDISSLPAGSFYNLPPQGQPVAFAPTQAGHGTFAGIYHPAQAVTAAAIHPLLQPSQPVGGAVDMVGPVASVYQQPQHQQINWPSNY